MIDLLFLIAFGWGFFIGFSRGIIKTVFTWLSVLFGVIIAVRFSPDVTDVLKTAMASDSPMLFIPGFLLTLVLTVVVIRFFSETLVRGLQSVHLNIINQIAGGLLSAAFFTLLYSMLLWFGNQAHIISKEAQEQSITYRFLEKYPQTTWKFLRQLWPTLQRFWGRSLEFIDKIDEYRTEQSSSDTHIYDIDEEGRRTPQRQNE